MYADIIIDISHEKLDKVFQYRIPDEMPVCRCVCRLGAATGCAPVM